jgi:arginyl-tRNA synthetase
MLLVMDFKTQILNKLHKFTKGVIELTVPPDPKLGDYAFPCFKIAKAKKKDPVKYANELEQQLVIKDVTVKAVGPFLNFHINKSKLAREVLGKILKHGAKFGNGNKSQKIMVEFFHANTHKGVHIGHIRTMALGSALCNILEKQGNKIIRANYQGDIGPHVAKCLWGYLNLKEKPPKNDKGIWLGKIYSKAHNKSKDNKKIQEEIKQLNIMLYNKDKDLIKIWKMTRQWCLDDFSKFYDDFDVKFNNLYFESEVEGPGKEIARELLDKGIAKHSEGAVIVDLKKFELGVCVILTSQGYALYQTKELGLAKKKLEDHSIDRSIHVVGSEQSLYFQQMFKIFELMKSPLATKSQHLSYGLVMLPGGKMSSRDGTMVLYHDLIGELMDFAASEITKRHKLSKNELAIRVKQISIGALKFAMLNRENNKDIVFDKTKVLDFEGETAAYIQYVNARISSILNKVKAKIKPNYNLITTSQESKILNLLQMYPEVIEESASNLKPHLIARYLLDVAQAFNEFYHSCQILKEEPKLRDTRLSIIKAVQIVIKNGLELLNIEAPDQM